MKRRNVLSFEKREIVQDQGLSVWARENEAQVWEKQEQAKQEKELARFCLLFLINKAFFTAYW